MVSCDPYQTFKIPLKTNEQSVIEHSLVTIYVNLEWPDNNHDNPNLLLHIFDKKTSPKPCKNDSSMSYFQQNQSSLFVNSIHQQQNFGSTYQQQYFHHSSVINNEPPATTTTTITTGDHNDVSSTTTTVVFSALQPPLAPPPTSTPTPSSHIPLQQIKSEPKTQLSPLYRRQPSMNSSPICSSTNQQYLSAQHVIQTPSTNNMDTQSSLQMSPTIKTISPTSTNTIPTKQAMTHMIDFQQSSPLIPSYPTSASTFKAFVCNCLKQHNLHEQNCPTLTLVKQSNSTLTSQTIVCRPPINRTIAQRAAVASQNRMNRSISMTPVKDQGQTATTLLPYTLANLKTSESIPNITTIVSEQQTNVSTAKKPIVRQRSTGSVNNARQRKKRLIKQVSVPNGMTADQSMFFNQINLNDPKSQSSTSPTNPTIKLVSPFSLQTTVTNSEIDQTINDVINGKGEIPLNDSVQTKTQIPQPSSQLVWVQNGTVTTKTWLSPLYQKQQSQTTIVPPTTQSTYDPLESTLTHQDVVNIAQQVVFPTNTEQNQLDSILQTTNNSKKKTRSKSIHNTPLKRNRKPSLNNRSQSKSTITPPPPPPPSSSQLDLSTNPVPIPTNQPPITPIHNLINKPNLWPNTTNSTPPLGSVTTTNPSQLSSFDKNDSWQSQCIENVDSVLDEFHLVSIDEQRMNSTNHFDFDLSIDGFSSKTNDRFTSSTPPPPLTLDHQRYSLLPNDKHHQTNSTTLMNNSRLTTGDLDVYDHFLNPYSSSMWQENQVSSSVSTPPDFQLNHMPSQHPQMQIQQSSQQYYPPPSSSQLTAEHFDQYHSQSQSQARLLFDVQS